jgi:hypothetical protein
MGHLLPQLKGTRTLVPHLFWAPRASVQGVNAEPSLEEVAPGEYKLTLAPGQSFTEY